jgi:hypothetical protein
MSATKFGRPNKPNKRNPFYSSGLEAPSKFFQTVVSFEFFLKVNYSKPCSSTAILIQFVLSPSTRIYVTYY